MAELRPSKERVQASLRVPGKGRCEAFHTRVLILERNLEPRPDAEVTEERRSARAPRERLRRPAGVQAKLLGIDLARWPRARTAGCCESHFKTPDR
jgi:hypothetical protein